MKTRLEKAMIVNKYLEIIGDGYETGDFSELFDYLAEDCVLESQWVLAPNVGREAIIDYYTGKGQTVKNLQAFPEISIVELVGNMNPIESTELNINGSEKQTGTIGLLYEAGEYCLLMEQTINEKTNGVILRIQLNDEEQITRIDLCMPELFRYRYPYQCIALVPARGEDENEDATIHIYEAYFSELYLFMGIADLRFDEYVDFQVSITKWKKALEYWKQFYTAATFDEAFETICGIDYESFSARDKGALRRASHNGEHIWSNRKNNLRIIDDLMEWTEKYSREYDCVNFYGY